MYLDYFGLSRMPFETVSNASVYVDLPDHRDALNTILFGLRSGEGFVKITGEVGTGKTALCRSLLARLDDSFVPVYLPNPSMSRLDLLHAIADELGIPMPPRTSFHLAHKYLREVLLDVARSDSRVVIFVDEAQTAPAESLEELRLLSNLESSQGRLVQVVLFGQPELDGKLSAYSMRQLQQRITWSARLSPIDRKSCRDYVCRRLAAAGAARPDRADPPREWRHSASHQRALPQSTARGGERRRLSGGPTARREGARRYRGRPAMAEAPSLLEPKGYAAARPTLAEPDPLGARRTR